MNKIQRLRAVFAGEVVDRIPAGFWFHYPNSYGEEEMIRAHLELYRKTDADVVKLMQDYLYPVEGQVKTTADWAKIRMPGRESKVYQKLEAVIKGVADQVGGEVLLFQTLFGPFKAASFAFGDELLMAHAKEDPAAVAAGVNIIAEGMAQWAEGYLEAGAGGLYYTAQFGEVGRFTDEEWKQLVYPSDQKILGVAKERKKHIILHLCGEPEYDFKVHLERFKDYPGDIVNWSVKDNNFSLAQGRELFGRPVLGGINNKGNILSGSEEAIAAEVTGAIDGFGSARGLMIGADCTIQGEGISLDRIAAAVRAAHEYPVG